MRLPTGRLTRLLVCAFAWAALGGCGTLSGALRADSSPLATSPPTSDVPPASLIAPAAWDDAPVAAAAAATTSTVALAARPAVSVDRRVCAIPVEPTSLDGIGYDTAFALGDAVAVGDVMRTADVDAAGDVGVMAQARDTGKAQDEDMEVEEYDPWEKFNEKTFEFNHRLDRYVLKPVAQVYNKIMPEPFQVAISNGFDNIAFIPRMVNSLLQGKWGGAGRELSRFLINSTAGIGGLFDPAKDYWGIRKSREDFGQTLGVWGAGPGPYVVVPFLEPLTVRDGVGKFVDLWLDPSAYFLPLIWTRLAMKVSDTVNDRSLNLELFQGFEESVIDLYSAVRHGYLQRRQNLIKE